MDKKKKDNDGYERYCFICRRPESVTGKMIDLPTNICVCPDCMQKSFDAMNNGGFDYSKFINIPMSPIMGFGDQENQMPKQQKVKKKSQKDTVELY